MYYIGIDLHKQDLMMAVEDERGPVGRPRRIACRDMDAIRAAVERWRPFRAVVEASASYRWLYDLLAPVGEVVLAHPLRLRAITAARGVIPTEGPKGPSGGISPFVKRPQPTAGFPFDPPRRVNFAHGRLSRRTP